MGKLLFCPHREGLTVAAPRQEQDQENMTSMSENRRQGSCSTKNGKNGAVFLAEELQAAQAQRRIAHGLCRRKEESPERRVWRTFIFLVHSS